MHYLVELEFELDVNNRGANAFVAQCRTIPGVRKVVLLEAISRETLDVLLLQPTPRLEKAEPSTFDNIRRYHRRKRQPELPGIA